MIKSFIYILFLGILATSCIPLKDQIYLQNKGNAAKKNIEEVQVKPYRLQVNDIISIKIKTIDPKLAEIFSSSINNNNAAASSMSAEGLYFNGYTIDDHGNIRIPVIGEVNVLGFTSEEVRKKIEEILLADYFKEEAQIFVDVKLSGFRFTVNGEVGSTGSKILYQDKVTILEAIANAGDIDITGDKKDVKVIRQFPQGSETFSIDLTDVTAMSSPVYYLKPNDYIYVKPLKQKSWGTGKTGIESLGTIITLLSLATTTFLLLKK
jgi:polysaccharide biosynthesis/export protein